MRPRLSAAWRNDVIGFVRFCIGEFLVGYRNGRARAARRIEMGDYFEGASPMARQANLIISRKDAELAAMKRRNETLQSVINAVAEDLVRNEGKWLHITLQQMVFAHSTNVDDMEE